MIVFGICGNFVSCLTSSDVEPRILPLVAELSFADCADAPLLGVRIAPGVAVDDVSPLPEESPEAVGGGRGRRRRNQACRNAELGVIRVAGSHSRQRRIKSRKSGSSQPFNAVCSSRDPGGPRGLPRLERLPLRTVVPSGSVVAVQYLRIKIQ